MKGGHGPPKTGSTIASFDYTYDKTMHITMKDEPTKAAPVKHHGYAYDDAYRLTHSVPTPLDPASNDMRAEDFTFDLLTAGHRTAGPDSIETYTYGQDNRLTSLALATPLTTAENYTYTYDYENRLTGVVKVAGGITTTVTYKYDPFGRRIQKRVQTTQNGQNVVNVFIYVYDNEDVILERESTTIGGGTPTVTVKKYVHGPGVDEPLAVAKGNKVYYYHADGVGSIVALTNGTEATVEGYTYDSFGKFQRYGNAVMNTYGFTGREYDEETGLYYYRARYYDPETGRFISKDPIGFAGGDANLYNYVLGDPVNWGDPWGLAVYPWTFPPIAIYDYVIPPSVIFAGSGVAVAGGAAAIGGFGSIPVTGPAGVLIGTTGAGVVFTGISTVGLGIDMYLDLLRRDFGLPLDLIPNINFFPKKKMPVNGKEPTHCE